jgi:MFS family permease
VLDLSPGEVGTEMGLIAVIGGVLGAVGYGAMVDRQFTRGKIDFALTAYAYSTVLTSLICIFAFIVDHHAAFIAAVIAIQCLLSAGGGSTIAAILMSTPPQMRGRMGALVVIVISMVGYAIGPMVVGAFTDFLFADPQKVGWSIALTICIIGPLATWCSWSARPLFVARLQETAAPPP